MKQELKNVFDKTFLSISVDSTNRWVHTDWVGYLTEENIRAGALAYTQVVNEIGFSCVLNDTSQVVGSWSHSLDWVINEWSPQAADAGIKYFALITTPESFAEGSAAKFYANIKAFQVKVFEDINKAKAWLQQYSLKANF